MSGGHSLAPLKPVFFVFILLLGVLWWAFDGYLEQRERPNRGLAEQATSGPLVLERSRDGHYRAPGTINGQPVRFLVDTGASTVAVSGALADTLGLARGQRMRVQTAAGPHPAYTTRLDRVALGPIAVDNVRGAIVPGMGGDHVLLGMSFLGHLDMRFTDRRLELR